MASLLNKYIAEFDELWENSLNILDRQTLDADLADIQLTTAKQVFRQKFKMWDANNDNE